MNVMRLKGGRLRLRFRRLPMTKSILPFLAFLCAALPVGAGEPVSLLSGDSLEAWTTKEGEAPAAGWVMKGGVLHRKEKAGDLISKEEYSNFELEWEWKIAPGGNSGIKFWVTAIGKQMLGIEYQIIDDSGHSDALNNADHTVGCIYDLVEASSDKKVNPPGEWNSSRVVARDGKIEHWLNGQMVASADTASDDYKERFAKSKYVKYEGFAPGHGKILIQDHGDEVWFRNMRVTRL